MIWRFGRPLRQLGEAAKGRSQHLSDPIRIGCKKIEQCFDIAEPGVREGCHGRVEFGVGRRTVETGCRRREFGDELGERRVVLRHSLGADFRQPFRIFDVGAGILEDAVVASCREVDHRGHLEDTLEQIANRDSGFCQLLLGRLIGQCRRKVSVRQFVSKRIESAAVGRVVRATGEHPRMREEALAANHQISLDHAVAGVVDHAPRDICAGIGAVIAVGRLRILLLVECGHHVGGPRRAPVKDPVLRRNNLMDPSAQRGRGQRISGRQRGGGPRHRVARSINLATRRREAESHRVEIDLPMVRGKLLFSDPRPYHLHRPKRNRPFAGDQRDLAGIVGTERLDLVQRVVIACDGYGAFEAAGGR